MKVDWIENTVTVQLESFEDEQRMRSLYNSTQPNITVQGHEMKLSGSGASSKPRIIE